MSRGRYSDQVRGVLQLTLGLNLLVVGIKLVVGLTSGSLAVIADAMHSLTDSANNILGLIVLRLATAPPDREHPYGHQKYEAIGALAIAAMLAIACFEVLRGAAQKLWSGNLTVPEMAPLDWVLLLSVLVINIGVAVGEGIAGRRLGSPLLQADSQHTLGDVWVTLGVLVGLLGSRLLGLAWADVALALPVAAMVLWSGWRVLARNLPWLLDASAVPADEIEQQVLAIPGVAGCHDITSRGMAGQQLYIELHITTALTLLGDAHRLAEQVREQLETRYAPARVTVHLEPAHTR